jgi:hypothetical protein
MKQLAAAMMYTQNAFKAAAALGRADSSSSSSRYHLGRAGKYFLNTNSVIFFKKKTLMLVPS